MESSLASWQFENFSTAELSPPISPNNPSSPHSPSLYNYGGISPNPIGKDVLKNPGRNDFFGGNGIQAPLPPTTNLLQQDLEQFENMQYDFPNNWNEPSVNLELFSELSELDDYVPASTPSPVSPSASYQQQNFIAPASVSPIPQSPIAEHANEFSPEVFNKLSAEFQAILESLPPQSQAQNEGGIVGNGFNDLIEFSNIPSAPFGNANSNAGVEFTNYFPGMTYFMDEDSNNTNAGSIYYSSSSAASSPGSYGGDSPQQTDIGISNEMMEENADAAEKILDALLNGNLPEAESYLPTVQSFPGTLLFSGPETMATTVPALPAASTSSSSSGVINKPQQQIKSKTESRRSKNTGGRRANGVVDRTLRKKEQNKTAATRYRLKKKLEAVVTSEVENTMQKANDALQAESNDLAKQISIVKQLLRDIRAAKQLTRNFASSGRN